MTALLWALGAWAFGVLLVLLLMRGASMRSRAEEHARHVDADARKRSEANEILSEPIPRGAALRARMRARWLRASRRAGAALPGSNAGSDRGDG